MKRPAHRKRRALREIEIVQNRGGGTGPIQRVEVKAGHALAQQLFRLPCRVLDPECRHRLVVCAAPIELVDERLWQVCAAQRDEPFDLRRAQNGLNVAKREGRNRVVEMSPDGPIWEMERRA